MDDVLFAQNVFVDLNVGVQLLVILLKVLAETGIIRGVSFLTLRLDAKLGVEDMSKILAFDFRQNFNSSNIK